MRAGRSGCASCARSSTSSRGTDTSAVDRAVRHRDLQSLGVLGGSFNPPHLGHRALALHAREQLQLQLVVLMPTCVSPLKSDARDPGAEHRLNMCRLLVAGAPGLSVCALEIERGGPSYTVDTLRSLHASHPDAELTFIVGADTASTLPRWHEPDELLELADLAVAARAGSTRRGVLELVAGLGAGARRARAVGESGQDGHGRGGCRPGAAGVRFLDMPVVEASSSLARERAAHGLELDELVGEPVARYIAEHDLYGNESGG